MDTNEREQISDETRSSVERGLQQSAAGETEYLGDFTEEEDPSDFYRV